VNDQPTHTRTPSLPPIVCYILAAVAFGTLAAWLVNALACYHELWRYCGGSTYVTLAGLVALGVIGPLAWTYRERALRRASRGMYARGRGVGHELAATFGRVVKFAWEGPAEENPPGLITGTQRFQKLGWWITIPLDGGQVVWVSRERFWLWLIEVEGLRYQLGPGESEIGQRYWEPKIGRPTWLAHMRILEAVGAVETLTPDPRSRRYVGGGDAWGWVEEYEKWRVGQGLPANEER
jgi:hypothetical protein